MSALPVTVFALPRPVEVRAMRSASRARGAALTVSAVADAVVLPRLSARIVLSIGRGCNAPTTAADYRTVGVTALAETEGEGATAARHWQGCRGRLHRSATRRAGN